VKNTVRIIAFALASVTPSLAIAYGEVLGNFGGVTVYSNANPPSGSNGGDYQCVEYVRRYYDEVYDLDLRALYTGNANTWYANAATMNLSSYANGSTTRPEVGDILTSTGGTFGHVAIVSSVTDTQVCVAQQNFDNDENDSDGTHCRDMTGNATQGYTVSALGAGGGYAVQGWLRQQHTPTTETLQTRAWGAIEWYPQSTQSCSSATRWWKDGIETSSSVCGEITTFCSVSSPNVPESNNRFQAWWRTAREFFSSLKLLFGTYASACSQTTVLRTISVPSSSSVPNSIVAGNGAFPSHAVGYGSGALITSAASSGQPDFVAKSVVLKDSGDKERYAFALGNTVKVAAKFKNEGTANSPQAIEIRYYRSNGQKEDAHSDWVRVATSTIQASNMKVGDTHTENIQFTAPSTIGTYNIVACADRTQDSNNGDGQVVEKHESNNCSKEAVFTVARRTPEDRKKFLRNIMQTIND